MPDQSSNKGPTEALSPRIRDYLEAPRYAAIATFDEDGPPHQAVVWYGLADDGILINSRAERQWPRNLLRDPRISLAIQDWDVPNHWVGLKGSASLLHEGDAATADIMALARRYGKEPGQYAGQQRVSFLVRVERVFEYGG
jgi:PPOX class probable F420-dependent enzyme